MRRLENDGLMRLSRPSVVTAQPWANPTTDCPETCLMNRSCRNRRFDRITRQVRAAVIGSSRDALSPAKLLSGRLVVARGPAPVSRAALSIWALAVRDGLTGSIYRLNRVICVLLLRGVQSPLLDGQP